MVDGAGQKLAGEGRVAAARSGARRLPREGVDGGTTWESAETWCTAAAHTRARLLPDGPGELWGLARTSGCPKRKQLLVREVVVCGGKSMTRKILILN